MIKSLWKIRKKTIQEKITKAVSKCYADYLGDPSYCACCPLGSECDRERKKGGENG